MNREQQVKLNWKSILGAIAATAALGIGSSSVQASPEAELRQTESFEIAQIRFRSRISSPTPLNMRPRTHIPSPTTGSDYYDYHHDRYYRQYRGHNRYDRHGYGHHHDYDRRHGRHRGRNGRRGTVIIINPGSSNTYSNYNYTDIGGHIRIIRK